MKESVDLLEYVEETVQLKRTNKIWVGLCPIHDEKTPSFYVYPETGTFHCYGCGAHGTIIDYVMHTHGFKSPSEALEQIAREKGVLLDRINSEEWEKRKEAIQNNRRKAYMFFTEFARTLEYLKSRGISEKVGKKFGIGYNSFQNAITIPYFNTYGEVAGIVERTLEKEQLPKYKNSAESEAFKKSELLFGLDKARKEIDKRLYIVEGYFDVISFHELGEAAAVAYCGQSLTDKQVQLLSKHVNKSTKIYLIPDNDPTGLKFAEKNIFLLKNHLKNQIGVISLPNGCKDMNDFLLTGGKIDDLKAENHEMYLLKRNLELCLDIEDEYEVAHEYASKTRNKMIRAEMAVYLSERWNKDIELVYEHMNAKQVSRDYQADMYTYSQSFDDFKEFLKMGDEGKVFIGLTEVDKMINGMKPGEVCTVLGRSGAGKTTFILNLIYRAVMEQGHNVIFNSLELNRINIIPQFIQIHKDLPENKVIEFALSGREDKDIDILVEKMNKHLRVIDRGGQTLQDVELYAKVANKTVFEKPVSLIVIDYFQYLKTEGRRNDYEEKSNMAREMKEVAKRLNCVIVALTQANREGGGSGSEKLTMSSARDTGAIEESSDYMIGVYRPAADPKKTEEERQAVQHEMYCQVLKNRWGRTGEAEVFFNGMTKRIDNNDPYAFRVNKNKR